MLKFYLRFKSTEMMPHMPGAWMEPDPLADARQQPEIMAVRMKAQSRTNAIIEAREDQERYGLTWTEVVELKQETIYDSLDEDEPAE